MQPKSSKPGLTGKYTDMKWLLPAGACLLFLQCQKEEHIKIQEFKAEVLNGDCGVPRVEFKDNPDKVAAISQVSGWSTDLAFNLEEKYWQPGQKLLVQIRKPRHEEAVICTHLNVNYPAITIISARPLE